jgi:hypothetical protein
MTPETKQYLRRYTLFLCVLAVWVLFIVWVTSPKAWEAASTWDVKSGRYIATEDYKKRYGVTEVCQAASCYDSGHFVSGDEWNKRERLRQERR